MRREQFEAWWEINYHNGKPPRFGWAAWRDGDGYKIDDDESELDGLWQAWQAATNAMEAKCAALAAENAEMNKFIKADCWVWDDKSEEYIDAADCITETPATDAYLAEVRAQGADAVADQHRRMYEELKPINKFFANDHMNAQKVAELVAAQLRQEAAQ